MRPTHKYPTKFEYFDCLHCKLAKQLACSFNRRDSISNSPFDLLHSDIWGQYEVPMSLDLVDLSRQDCYWV